MKHRGSTVILACLLILTFTVTLPSTRFANNDVSAPAQSLGIPRKDRFGQPIDVGLLILGHSTSAIGDYPAKLAQALNADPNDGRNYVVIRVITNGDGGFLWTQLSFQPNDLQYDRARASQSPQQWCQDNAGARWSCRRARLEEGLTGVKPPSCFNDTSCSPPATISLTWSEGGVTQTGELSFHEAWKKMDIRLALIQDTTNRSWPVDDFNGDGAVNEGDYWPEARIPAAARPCGGTGGVVAGAGGDRFIDLNPQAPQRTSLFIPPRDTDPQINTHPESHYVALNQSAPSKNQLFLFFPGTNGTPFFTSRFATPPPTRDFTSSASTIRTTSP